MLIYKRASSDGELNQILEIQKRNLKVKLTEEEINREGFITVDHNFAVLRKMNQACAHIIAKDGDTVAGYALVMLRTFKDEIPVLRPMFDAADKLLGSKNYLAMGQICIDKPYRKMGLFKGMYGFYREALSNEFECLFTEVATNNIRSIAAHKSVGFKTLKTELTEGVSWELMNWDWK